MAIRSPRRFALFDAAGWLLMVPSPVAVVALLAIRAPLWAEELVAASAMVGAFVAIRARVRWRRLTDEAAQRLETLDRCGLRSRLRAGRAP